jgi:hypothetical protein
LSSPKRRLLSLRCAQGLSDPRITQEEAIRVFLAKLISALVPDSVEWLSDLLDPNPKASLAEVQFSLFCFLDVVKHDGVSERRAVLHLVEQYLMTISKGSADAAWMAGDLLGDHLPLEESLGVLISAASHGRHAAGRLASIHGLSHALPRATKRQQWAIVEALRQVVLKDRSAKVKHYASSVLAELRGF